MGADDVGVGVVRARESWRAGLARRRRELLTSVLAFRPIECHTQTLQTC